MHQLHALPAGDMLHHADQHHHLLVLSASWSPESCEFQTFNVWVSVLVWNSSLTSSFLFLFMCSGSSSADGVSLHPEGREGSVEDDHRHGRLFRHLLCSVCPSRSLLRLLDRRKQRLSTRHHPSLFL